MAISVTIVVGFTMALVVAVVAVVTLVITYTVSINAIHTSGQRLAGAMMDTVSTKVTNYNNMSEHAMHDVVNMVTIKGYMYPTNDTDPQWWVKWDVALRTHLFASDFGYSAIAVIYGDGGATAWGPYWDNSSFYYGYSLDARTLASDGSGLCITVSSVYRVIGTNRDCDPVYDNQTCYTPSEFSRGDNRLGGYYSVIDLLNRKPQCFWVTPGIDTYRIRSGEFTMYGSCVLVNATGTIVGTISVGRRLNDIGTFLEGAAATPGTQIFIIDPLQQLVAATYSAPYQHFYPGGTAGIKAGTNGCVSSLDQSPGYPEVIGCRSPASQYPYAPLQDLATNNVDFLSTTTRQERYGTVGGSTFFYIAAPVPSRNLIYTFTLLLFLPEDDILGDIVKGLSVAIGVTVAVFIVAVVFTNVLLHALLAPLSDVAARMYRVANLESSSDGDEFDLQDDGTSAAGDDPLDIKPTEKFTPSNMTEIRALQVAYETMDTAIKSFTRYVPRDVVKELVLTNQICEIAMRPLTCSMLFADIQGFTTLCERVPPHILSGLVKLYFEKATRIVMGHGGIIDKFIGDCVMAVWGAPIPSDRHELRSALCARSLVHETECDPLKSAFENVNEHLAIRVGVATGTVLAGNMGSSARMNYTVIGDEVNLASRLESLNRQWGTNTMISEATATECEEWLVLRHVVTIAVVGKDLPVEVYEVVGVRPDANTTILGAQTGGSEQQTLSEVKRDREREELGDAYLRGNARSDRMNVGQLVRRLMRKFALTGAQMEFAKRYTAAMRQFEKADFAGCMSSLRELMDDANVPQSITRCISVQRVLQACEEYLAAPPKDFRGSWKAESK